MSFLFALQAILYLFGAGAGFSARKNAEWAARLNYGGAALAGLAGMLSSGSVLLSGRAFSLSFPGGIPFFGPMVFRTDSLSAFFVFLISFLAVPVSIFAIGYTREYRARKNTAVLGCLYNLFLLSMVLVVTVQNAFYFMVAWEWMSLTSYFLVVFEHERPAARHAGLVYFVMTHMGAAFIITAFWILASASGSFSFDAFGNHAAALPQGLRDAVFICALIGFGTKAGLIPLHIWLPKAHPQAPSHVSALMSGVMIKTAVYALLRFIFGFLGTVSAWWGPVLLFFAILSVLLGILYALMENDLKRMLAFSSIENIGIVLLGAGMAVVFTSARQPLYAAFALVTALYHALNHAAFKGLLFLAAGSVLSATHTRNMEKLGGLVKTMPWTSAFFLIGSAAIAALPPLNGFVSEWMSFIALLAGFECDGAGIRFFAPILAALLGFAGALAATCFVKAFGIAFLGKPRSSCAAEAREESGSVKTGMGMLALACFGLAVAAPGIISVLRRTAGDLLNQKIGAFAFHRGAMIAFPSGLSRLSPVWVFAASAFFLGRFLFFFFFRMRGSSVRVLPSWDCGMPELSPRMQYSATGFSKPLRRIFSFLYRPTRKVEIEDEGVSVLRTATRFESSINPFFEETLYRPLARLTLFFSGQAKRIQTGYLQIYLAYIFVTLILLLVFARMS